MADVIDLNLVKDARRYLNKMLDARGLAFFLKNDRRRPFELNPQSVELVLRTASRSKNRQRVVTDDALEYARREIRRELIRQVVAEMLESGL